MMVRVLVAARLHPWLGAVQVYDTCTVVAVVEALPEGVGHASVESLRESPGLFRSGAALFIRSGAWRVQLLRALRAVADHLVLVTADNLSRGTES